MPDSLVETAIAMPEPLKRRHAVKGWHVAALQLALSGADAKEIARRLNQKIRSVQNLMKGDWMQRELTAFTRASLQMIEKERVDPMIRFQRLITKSIDKLAELVECDDPKVSYLAACRLLDNAGYTPVKRLHVSEDEKLSSLTTAQLRFVAITGRVPQDGEELTIEGEATDEEGEASTPERPETGGDRPDTTS